MACQVLVVGLGNRWRRDDGAGIAAAELLRPHASAQLEVECREQSPIALIDRWLDVPRVILIDALRGSGTAPGDLVRFDATCDALPRERFRTSTHALGVADFIELARATDRLPARLIVYGITGRDFGLGEGLSDEVRAAVERVVLQVLSEVARYA